MPDIDPGCRLGDLLTGEGVRVRPIADGAAILDRFVTRAQLLAGGLSIDGADATTLLIHIAPASADPDSYLADIRQLRASTDSHLIVTWPPPGVADRDLAAAAGAHVLLRAGPELDPVTLIAAVARAVRPLEQTMTQRLTSLQRAMTQALTEPEPLSALAARLAKTCNAVAAVVRADGELDAASGPLPLALLLSELVGRTGESRPFAVAGWHGIGVRTASEEGPAGWLLMASRRTSFPDPYAVAAAHVAASLVETNLRIDLLARRQDRAVRGALLEQLVSLRLERHDPELRGRLAAFGVSFTGELRVLSVTLLPGQHRSHRQAALEAMFRRLDQELTAIGSPHLLAARENSIVGLAEVSAATTRRIFAAISSSLPGFLLGVGRAAHATGDVADSYNDALLAIRTLRAPGRSATAMSYEDFDFATRLFADVGLDRMTDWAEETLRPLVDQQILLEGLRQYFEHDMNIIAAAKSLNIHHNSLRYRLARAEELLNLSLRDPAAVSSLFLALTATAMVVQSTAVRSESREQRRNSTDLAADALDDVFTERQGSLSSGLGVAIGPER